MKTRVSILSVIFLLTLICQVSANETIRGNRNIITEKVSISDYDEISVAGQMEVVYEQSNAAPYFEITIDENVLPYVNIEVKGSKLSVGPKQDGNSSYNLQPTKYKIKTNSKDLKKISKAGSGSFNVKSSLRTNKLDLSSAGSGSMVFEKDVACTNAKISMAGSGNISALGSFSANDQLEVSMAGSGYVKLNNKVITDKLKLNMAGSGSITANGIAVETANCSMSSSGGIKVSGTAKEVSYSVAGSGNIKAFDCKADQVKANLTGSGKIELYAVTKLNASTAGSGSISYKGNPSVESSAHGSGKVKKVN